MMSHARSHGAFLRGNPTQVPRIPRMPASLLVRGPTLSSHASHAPVSHGSHRLFRGVGPWYCRWSWS